MNPFSKKSKKNQPQAPKEPKPSVTVSSPTNENNHGYDSNSSVTTSPNAQSLASPSLSSGAMSAISAVSSMSAHGAKTAISATANTLGSIASFATQSTIGTLQTLGTLGRTSSEDKIRQRNLTTLEQLARMQDPENHASMRNVKVGRISKVGQSQEEMLGSLDARFYEKDYDPIPDLIENLFKEDENEIGADGKKNKALSFPIPPVKPAAAKKTKKTSAKKPTPPTPTNPFDEVEAEESKNPFDDIQPASGNEEEEEEEEVEATVDSGQGLIEEELNELEARATAVSVSLARRVMTHYSSFLIGLSDIQAVCSKLQAAAVECSISRRSLALAERNLSRDVLRTLVKQRYIARLACVMALSRATIFIHSEANEVAEAIETGSIQHLPTAALRLNALRKFLGAPAVAEAVMQLNALETSLMKVRRAANSLLVRCLESIDKVIMLPKDENHTGRLVKDCPHLGSSMNSPIMSSPHLSKNGSLPICALDAELVSSLRSIVALDGGTTLQTEVTKFVQSNLREGFLAVLRRTIRQGATSNEALVTSAKNVTNDVDREFEKNKQAAIGILGKEVMTLCRKVKPVALPICLKDICSEAIDVAAGLKRTQVVVNALAITLQQHQLILAQDTSSLSPSMKPRASISESTNPFDDAPDQIDEELEAISTDRPTTSRLDTVLDVDTLVSVLPPEAMTLVPLLAEVRASESVAVPGAVEYLQSVSEILEKTLSAIWSATLGALAEIVTHSNITSSTVSFEDFVSMLHACSRFVALTGNSKDPSTLSHGRSIALSVALFRRAEAYTQAFHRDTADRVRLSIASDSWYSLPLADGFSPFKDVAEISKAWAETETEAELQAQAAALAKAKAQQELQNTVPTLGDDGTSKPSLDLKISTDIVKSHSYLKAQLRSTNRAAAANLLRIGKDTVRGTMTSFSKNSNSNSTSTESKLLTTGITREYSLFISGLNPFRIAVASSLNDQDEGDDVILSPTNLENSSGPNSPSSTFISAFREKLSLSTRDRAFERAKIRRQQLRRNKPGANDDSTAAILAAASAALNDIGASQQPVVTSASFAVLRSLGQYLTIVGDFPPLASQAIAGLVDLIDFYVYSVAATFLREGPLDSLASTLVIDGVVMSPSTIHATTGSSSGSSVGQSQATESSNSSYNLGFGLSFGFGFGSSTQASNPLELTGKAVATALRQWNPPETLVDLASSLLGDTPSTGNYSVVAPGLSLAQTRRKFPVLSGLLSSVARRTEQNAFMVHGKSTHFDAGGSSSLLSPTNSVPSHSGAADFFITHPPAQILQSPMTLQRNSSYNNSDAPALSRSNTNDSSRDSFSHGQTDLSAPVRSSTRASISAATSAATSALTSSLSSSLSSFKKVSTSTSSAVTAIFGRGSSNNQHDDSYDNRPTTPSKGAPRPSISVASGSSAPGSSTPIAGVAGIPRSSSGSGPSAFGNISGPSTTQTSTSLILLPPRVAGVPRPAFLDRQDDLFGLEQSLTAVQSLIYVSDVITSLTPRFEALLSSTDPRSANAIRDLSTRLKSAAAEFGTVLEYHFPALIIARMAPGAALANGKYLRIGTIAPTSLPPSPYIMAIADVFARLDEVSQNRPDVFPPARFVRLRDEAASRVAMSLTSGLARLRGWTIDVRRQVESDVNFLESELKRITTLPEVPGWNRFKEHLAALNNNDIGFIEWMRSMDRTYPISRKDLNALASLGPASNGNLTSRRFGAKSTFLTEVDIIAAEVSAESEQMNRTQEKTEIDSSDEMRESFMASKMNAKTEEDDVVEGETVDDIISSLGLEDEDDAASILNSSGFLLSPMTSPMKPRTALNTPLSTPTPSPLKAPPTQIHVGKPLEPVTEVRKQKKMNLGGTTNPFDDDDDDDEEDEDDDDDDDDEDVNENKFESTVTATPVKSSNPFDDDDDIGPAQSGDYSKHIVKASAFYSPELDATENALNLSEFED